MNALIAAIGWGCFLENGSAQRTRCDTRCRKVWSKRSNGLLTCFWQWLALRGGNYTFIHDILIRIEYRLQTGGLSILRQSFSTLLRLRSFPWTAIP